MLPPNQLRGFSVNKLLLFITGGIAGYIASGWIEGFMEKKEKEARV
jgi:hypothetical protein